MSKTGAHLRIEQMGTAVMGVRLYGDPRRPEPDEFRVAFPGGDLSIGRCSDGSYWVHARVDLASDAETQALELTPGRFDAARLDCRGKHTSESDLGDFEREDLYHVALHITTGEQA